MNFSDVLQALDQASTFELFRLRAAIDGLIDAPARLLAIQRQLQIGQVVEYFDAAANARRTGSILALRRKVAVLLDRDDGKRWLIDYAAINLGGVDVHIRHPAPRGVSRNEIAVGDIVGFLDRAGRQCSGRVIKRNDKTASLLVGEQQWRVAYGLLHRVLEADVVEQGRPRALAQDGTPSSARTPPLSE